MAAASAGIGGGGLLVPIFLLVARFPASQAIPLSSATISGGAVANYFTYSRRCVVAHPLIPPLTLLYKSLAKFTE